MRKLCCIVLVLTGAVWAGAADYYPDVVGVLPATARAGQTIASLKIIGSYFKDFQAIEFRKTSGVDKDIKVTKVVKKDSSYVIVEVQIPAGLKGKRTVVVKTKVGASAIKATTDNVFEILPASTKKPDLKIKKITWGTLSVAEGNPVRVYVENAGGTAAKGFAVDLYLNGAKKLRYTWPGVLPAGSVLPFESFKFLLPLTAGGYNVKAVADPLGKVDEDSESNNTLIVPFTQIADQFVIESGGYATYGNTKGKVTPNFTLKDYRGKPLSLYDYRGRPILLVLGAMWSLYMQAETASLNLIQQDYAAKNLIVIQVLYDDLDGSTTVLTDPSPELVRAWAEGNKLIFPVLGDVAGSEPGRSAYYRLAANGQPMNYIMRADGSVQALLLGFYEQNIRTALDNATKDQ